MSRRLESLLDKTRDALIIGDIPGLAGLAAEIELLTTGLSGLDRNAAELLRSKADRNARLLQAALRGVRSARQRLADMTSAASITTYDSQGRREILSGAGAAQPRRV